MDHFCPWMANVVGYFNYRYFLNFLIYVFLAMVYGCSITYKFFMMEGPRTTSKRLRDIKAKPDMSEEMMRDEMAKLAGVPHLNHSDKSNIMLCFMLCSAVGLAVFGLLSFHIYLTLTAQSTIEFHANWDKKKRARHLGVRWVNPYDLGWKRNWRQVYGYKTKNWLLALLPSSREPEFVPVPLPGNMGKRGELKDQDEDDIEMGGLNARNETGNYEGLSLLGRRQARRSDVVVSV